MIINKTNRCAEPGCRNHRDSGKLHCAKHYKRIYKLKNPIVYTFNALKSNAKRREKPFILTIDEFRKFCNDTNYIELKGRTSTSASIDRIDNKLGYSLDNIRVLQFGLNSIKSDNQYCPF